MASVNRSTPGHSHAKPRACAQPAADKVGFIIVKAREYDVKEGDSDPEEGSNATDDGNTES